jgi:hypothetical protein
MGSLGLPEVLVNNVDEFWWKVEGGGWKENSLRAEKLLRMAEGGVDLGDLSGKEGAARETGEMLQIRIFSEQPTEFLPGGLGLDEGEIHLGQLSTAKCIC